MRKAIGALSALLLVAGLAWAQSQPVSLGEVARQVRAQRAAKDISRVRLFTNDSIPQAGAGVSVVGEAAAPPAAAPEGEITAEAGAAGEAEAAKREEEKKCEEECWRGRFRAQREKIRTAQRELDLLQREFNVNRLQYYQDPNQAMREQYSGTTAGGRELQELLQKISDKQAEIQRYQRELSELENQLRREGGKPGWARE